VMEDDCKAFANHKPLLLLLQTCARKKLRIHTQTQRQRSRPVSHLGQRIGLLYVHSAWQAPAPSDAELCASVSDDC